MIVKAIITTLDNLNILKEQICILNDDLLIAEIIVVNNGSVDGTKEWLEKQDVIIVNRKNKGAGPGRNAGLDKARKSDYLLMLDGGIRPLKNGVKIMLDFLERRQDVDVLGVEIPHFETDYNKAWRRWPNKIEDGHTYRNTRLSHTAYCLARYKAFDNIRFCEEGPFGEPGWGADDDELAYQWNDKGIVVHSVTNIHPYRYGGGSFRRLYGETGIWPNQYGSVYEKRLVYLQQKWAKYKPGVMWGRPWITIVIKFSGIKETVKLIKYAHDTLRKRHFGGRWSDFWNPYHIVVLEGDKNWKKYAEHRRLRQHSGDVIIINGNTVKRDKVNEELWTGDFILIDSLNNFQCPYYYGIISNKSELDKLINLYNKTHLRQDEYIPPSVNFEKIGLKT